MNPTLSILRSHIWPCRKGAIDKSRARFSPHPKATLWQWFGKLEKWLLAKGIPGGARIVRLVYQSLVKMIDPATGRLDPGYRAIAAKAGCSRSAVYLALKLLRVLGVITWDQCCTRGPGEDGGFEIRQDTNAYRLLPPSEWRGYVDQTPPPPPPDRDAWGAAYRLQEDEMDGWMSADSWDEKLELLASNPDDQLSCRLAALGRAIKPPSG